ncbi:MAG TPA: rubrerythrin-like domain-containing protein [Halobacteriales archaeon]|nr:rubrerythrin-like domain-containing protein [Halobacteriales archaeon]
MPSPDPYQRDPPLSYECVDCGGRVRAEHHPGTCDACDGQMVDVSVPRE